MLLNGITLAVGIAALSGLGSVATLMALVLQTPRPPRVPQSAPVPQDPRVRHLHPRRGLHRWVIPVNTGKLELSTSILPIERPKTGDPSFDKRFQVGGDLFARACLSAEVRQALLALPTRDIRIEGGSLWMDESDHRPEAAHELLQVANALARVPSDPHVRLQAWWTELPAAQRVWGLASLGQQSPELALELAHSLREDGDDLLRALARHLVLGEDSPLLNDAMRQWAEQVRGRLEARPPPEERPEQPRHWTW